MAIKKIKIGDKISFNHNGAVYSGTIEWIASSGSFLLVKDHNVSVVSKNGNIDCSVTVEVSDVIAVL